MADANATATLGIEVGVKGADETKQKLDGVDQSVKKLATSSAQFSNGPPLFPPNKPPIPPDVPQKVSALSRALDFMRGVFGGASEEISRSRAVHSLYAAAAGQTTEAVTRTASATHNLRAAIETLRPVLAGAGAQFGAFGGLIGAARAGLGGLAIAIGGGIVASLERAAEGTETLRKRFTALNGDTKQFEQLKQTARETGASLDTLAAVTQTLNGALERGQVGKWVGDLSQISHNSTLAAKSLADLSKAAGADLAAVSEALKGVLTNGQFTKQVFIDIVHANEAVGLAIARAFHQPTIAAMVADLERAPRPARELKAALEGIGPIIGDVSGRTTTLTSAIGQVKQGVLDLADALGTTLVGKTISAFGQFLSWTARAIISTSQLRAAVNSLTLGGRGGAPQQPSFQVDNGSTLFDSGGSTGFGPPPGSVTAPSGFNPPRNSISPGSAGTGGSTLSEPFMGEEFVGAFASGGSFMVGGSGSTDSRRISMAVTPGERVTVTPPATNSTPVGGVGGSKIIQNFIFPNASPQSFAQSMSQVRRAARQVLA